MILELVTPVQLAREALYILALGSYPSYLFAALALIRTPSYRGNPFSGLPYLPPSSEPDDASTSA